MTPRPLSPRLIRRRPWLRRDTSLRGTFAVAVTCAWLAALPAAAHAQASDPPVSVLFERAQARAEAALSATPMSVAAIRAAATTFEEVFRDHWSSGYADNAVWECAQLYGRAYELSQASRDVERAQKWYAWLKSEYPDSPLRKKVDAAVEALTRPPAPSASSASAGSPVTSSTSANSAMSSPAAIKDIDVSVLPQGQRIAITLNHEAHVSSERVDDPDRVYFDFQNTSIPAAMVARAQAISSAWVKSVRIGHPLSGVTRVVLDLTGHPRYTAGAQGDAARFVIDIVDSHAPAPAPAPPPSPAAAASPAPGPSARESDVVSSVVVPRTSAGTSTVSSGVANYTRPNRPAAEPKKPVPAAPPPVSPAPATKTSAGDYSLSRQLGLGISTVVIDAGHGGHDPGAMANGITEAELTLDVAQRLAKMLTDLGGFHVVLTRNSDEFIALQERTAIAKRQDADLFLSIHANASEDSAARGVETYFLSVRASTQSAAAVAARENALNGATQGALPEVVKAIALTDKLQESHEFANIVQSSMTQKMSSQNKALKDLGVKQAPFVVLIGADVPSVLAEISFLTNRNEATLLKQDTFRKRIAQALCEAVVKYQGTLKKAAPVTGGR